MAIDLQERLDNIRVKADMLVSRFEEQRERCRLLEQTVDRLEKQVADLTKSLERLKVDNELLRTAGLLNPTREDVERSRAMLSQLVRDIDRCIAELTE